MRNVHQKVVYDMSEVISRVAVAFYQDKIVHCFLSCLQLTSNYVMPFVYFRRCFQSQWYRTIPVGWILWPMFPVQKRFFFFFGLCSETIYFFRCMWIAVS